MSALAITFENAEVLQRYGFEKTPLSIAEGLIVEDGAGRAIDLAGYHILPGIVDLHGDGFERHLAPRRGAVKDLQSMYYALHSELASNGITTAVLAQFYIWEGGMRGPDFAREFLEHFKQFAPKCPASCCRNCALKPICLITTPSLQRSARAMRCLMWCSMTTFRIKRLQKANALRGLRAKRSKVAAAPRHILNCSKRCMENQITLHPLCRI